MGTVPTFSPAITRSDLRWWIVSRPRAYLLSTVAQLVADSTWSPCLFQSASIDTDTGHSGSSARYLIGNTLGDYRVSAAVPWAAASSGFSVAAQLVVNGTAVPGSLVKIPSSTQPQSVVIPPCTVHSTINTDYVELQVWQNTGGSIYTAVAGACQAQMSITFDGT